MCCFHLFTVVNNAAVSVGVYPTESPLSVLWGAHPEVEVLDHIVMSCFKFLRNISIFKCIVNLPHWVLPKVSMQFFCVV